MKQRFSMPVSFRCGLMLAACCCITYLSHAQDDASVASQEIVKSLRQIDSRVLVLGTVRQPPLASMLQRDVDARLDAANRSDREQWEKVRNRAEWMVFRDQRIAALRRSLGELHDGTSKEHVAPKVHVTGSIKRGEYEIDKLVYESRPGLVVTANLYRPVRSGSSPVPGIVICHSHQSTKHSTWRQDMAATWARAGCMVLVPDHLGHGERRQHAFGEEPPHDYHFRYDLGIQLHLIGESLMGWLVWDLQRAVDILFNKPEIDRQRLVLISEPAGGGDVAAVAAALDPRITCAMIQNFGGPEPENAFPLDKYAELTFDYAGRGSWESTRNLRLSARDGFLPWLIVGAIAPRKLIYYHEFYWDKAHDPVWKRLERIYAWEQTNNSLVGLAGRGFVVGSSPENSHWLPENRALLYPVMERWLSIPNPRQEWSDRLPEAELRALTPELRNQWNPQGALLLAQSVADRRLRTARDDREKSSHAFQREPMRKALRRLLGDIDPIQPASLVSDPVREELQRGYSLERLPLLTESGITVPTLLLLPAPRTATDKSERPPVVIAVAQQGKEAFLRERATEIANLLQAGVAVCLPDVRGVGETSPGDARDRRGASTSISSSEWMLGQSLLGGRLRDVRSVLAYLRTRTDLNTRQPMLWGDSFAAVNPDETEFAVPHTASNRPHSSEPLGGLLVLLTALFDDHVDSITIHQGLADYRSVLAMTYCYVPHDVVIPGLLATCDLPDLVGALAPRRIQLLRMVGGDNRILTDQEMENRYSIARKMYDSVAAREQLHWQASPTPNTLIEALIPRR